jgi:hypothetical protein
MRKTYCLALILILFFAFLYYVSAQPTGAGISYNVSETKPATPAVYLNTSGGTFTTIILSGDTQNLKWKAYAGNVTGVLTLDDSGDYSIFQWQPTSVTGQVYASRNDSVTWSTIGCAAPSLVVNEDTYMNHTTGSIDSINNTFNVKIHKQFYVGNIKINQSSCKSAFTWANDTAQSPSINAPFQEVLLSDSTNLVYTTFVDDNIQGFNFKKYDFQMIVAEKGVGGYANTRYYFYLELQ